MSARTLVTARQDRWLTPRFNSDAKLQVCSGCARIADFANSGHGALRPPPPPDLTGLDAELLGDPPGFDRAEVSAAEHKIVGFFKKHLLH